MHFLHPFDFSVSGWYPSLFGLLRSAIEDRDRLGILFRCRYRLKMNILEEYYLGHNFVLTDKYALNMHIDLVNITCGS